MRFAFILILVAMIGAPAFADEAANDTALKMGSRVALVCDRQTKAATIGYPANHLHQFGPCIRATDFGDETTPAEHIQTYMKRAAAYYLAVENFGQMTQRDYGTVGANEMKYLTSTGMLALNGLDAMGYGSEKICATLSWIDCTRFKALPRK